MLYIKDTNITLTRGDSANIRVGLFRKDPETGARQPYEPQEGDIVRFAMKRDYEEATPLILKEIPAETMILSLDPEDTKNLDFGSYVYDIEITFADGAVNTFIDRAKFKLTEEVY